MTHTDGGNRLAAESSPYLRQHAHNPVDWYPWGPEAFERARAEDRPVLLSVGYSACHWCHVMEHESFDDPVTAALMNRDFVNIKVDREERPDVDGIYMAAVQALTGRGGWPLTAFLTPEGVPFYGGTYFPPEPRHGMPSFRRVLEAVSDAWRNRRDDVLADGGRLLEALSRSARDADPGSGRFSGTAVPGTELEDHAYRHLAQRFDPVHGGFGGAPKFPQPVTLEFLLAYGMARGEQRAIDMVVHTLRAMASGGIRDHLGGGFHRYSVDERWLVPHFEKMLYDNALLSRIYLDAYRITGDAEFRAVVEETLEYVLEDLRDAEGGFYAARDADSEGEEGLFYLWTPSEVASATGKTVPDSAAVRLFEHTYDVTREGNFEGRNILHLPHPMKAVAARENVSEEALRARLVPVREAMLEARSKREPPFRDEKVICTWSAFAVRALAEAGRALGRDDFLDAAVAGGRFLVDRLGLGEEESGGGILRIWTAGEAKIPGFLEDWGALGNACLTLHEVTLDPDWMHHARRAGDEILSRFRDDDGLLYDAEGPRDGLVIRPRNLMDNATPSGNALAVELFLRGSALLDAPAWRTAAAAVLGREGGSMERFPGAFGRLLTQVVRANTEPCEVAIFGSVNEPNTNVLLGVVHGRFHANRIVAGGDPDEVALPDLPLFSGRGRVDGAPTAWICRDFACRAPLTDPTEVGRALDEEAAR